METLLTKQNDIEAKQAADAKVARKMMVMLEGVAAKLKILVPDCGEEWEVELQAVLPIGSKEECTEIEERLAKEEKFQQRMVPI